MSSIRLHAPPDPHSQPQRLAAADSVSGLTLNPTYDRATDTYNVVTSQDQVKITPTALCSGTAITVPGSPPRVVPP